MEEVHQDVHLAGTDLLARTSRSSSPSSAAVQPVSAHGSPPPLLLSRRIVLKLKHLRQPDDSVRLGEFNSAIRQSDRAGIDEGGGKRKAGMSSQVMSVEPGQLFSDGFSESVPEARSANVGDDRKAADTETDDQKFAGSVRPGEFGFDHDNILSEHMVCALGSVGTCVLSVPEREEVASGIVRPASEANDLEVSPKACDGANKHEVTPTPAAGTDDVPKGEDVIGAEDDQPVVTHLKVPAQETDQDLDPAAELWASSSSDTDDDDDLYNLGVAAAMEMDPQTLESEVAKYLRQEANRDRPQRRAAAQRNGAAANPAPPAKFSLRLSYREAMEDVMAVCPAKDVRLEAEVPALPPNAKRRRGS